jgi:hypothetical protein
MLQAVLYIVIAGSVPWHSKASLIVVPKTGYPCLRRLPFAYGIRVSRRTRRRRGNRELADPPLAKAKPNLAKGIQGSRAQMRVSTKQARLGGSPALIRPCGPDWAWLETRVILRPGRPGPPQL